MDQNPESPLNTEESEISGAVSGEDRDQPLEEIEFPHPAEEILEAEAVPLSDPTVEPFEPSYSEPLQPEIIQPGYQPPPKKDSNGWVIALIVLLVLCCCCVLSLMMLIFFGRIFGAIFGAIYEMVISILNSIFGGVIQFY